MFHLVAHAVPGTLLFRDWEEGVHLYEALADRLSGIVALCVMPDHLHAMVRGDNRHPLAVSVSGWTRWRNARRGETGRAVRPIPLPHFLATPDKIRRSERYIHLNPCRAGLTHDPLGWPLSAYRDAVGLGLRPCRPPARDPVRLHAYITGDESVRLEARYLPTHDFGSPTLGAIAESVAALHRRPRSVLSRRGPARTLFLRAARTLTTVPTTEVAHFLDLSPRAVRAIPRERTHAVRLVERVCNDVRFSSLPAGRRIS